MPDVDWSSVVPTLVGAVVGGALTLIGSIFASARDVRRQRRLRIYEELLPQLDKLHQWGHEEGMPAWLYYDQVWPWLLALRRSAALTGPTERRMVQRIMNLHGEYQAANQAAIDRSAGRELSLKQQKGREPYDVIGDLDNVVEKYRRLLARKIR